MNKKPLTNKNGKVRELTKNDIYAMQPATKVLPLKLLKLLSKSKLAKKI